MDNINSNKQEKNKDVIIIVNTREKTWSDNHISYEQVITLAFDTYIDNPNIVYSITYKKGDEKKHEGSLVKGESVPVKNGMIFNVTQTDKS